MGNVIQATNEILLYAGDETTFSLDPKDGKGDTIDVTGTVDSLTFKAYKFLDDGTEVFNFSEVVVNGGNIDVTSSAADTVSEEPMTYMYVVKGNVDGYGRTLINDQITILRSV